MQLEEEAVLARDAVALDDLRCLSCDLADPVELAGRGRNAYDCRDRVPELGRVDVDVVAADHAVTLEPLNALGDRRRGEVDTPP